MNTQVHAIRLRLYLEINKPKIDTISNDNFKKQCTDWEQDSRNVVKRAINGTLEPRRDPNALKSFLHQRFAIISIHALLHNFFQNLTVHLKNLRHIFRYLICKTCLNCFCAQLQLKRSSFRRLQNANYWRYNHIFRIKLFYLQCIPFFDFLLTILFSHHFSV